jgi:hypothetical protein
VARRSAVRQQSLPAVLGDDDAPAAPSRYTPEALIAFRKTAWGV